MIRTRVGYAGGITASPTYGGMGDHSETIQVDYDPDMISYGELLDIFWDGHNTVSPSSSRQYASIIHYETAEEKALAEESLRQQEEVLEREVYTEIIPLGTFTLAEDYHQKYYLQNRRNLIAEFKLIYPEMSDLVNSTAAARANGYVGNNGTLEMLEAEAALMGLSPDALAELRTYFE